MFLDADDVIAPTKVARQLAAMRHLTIGWVLCDVEHRPRAPPGPRALRASKKYGYAKARQLNGWLKRRDWRRATSSRSCRRWSACR
jgi:hypothetical protein